MGCGRACADDWPQAAQAATVDIVAIETDGNVVLTGSGSVDLFGLSLAPLGSIAFSGSDQQQFAGVPAGSALYDAAPTAFSPLASTNFSYDWTGDAFGGGADSNFSTFALFGDYASLDPIRFVWTVNGASFASLGLNFGTLAQIGNTTLTLTDGLTPVPLPASGLLLVGGLAGVWLAIRARSHRRRPPALACTPTARLARGAALVWRPGLVTVIKGQEPRSADRWILALMQIKANSKKYKQTSF